MLHSARLVLAPPPFRKPRHRGLASFSASGFGATIEKTEEFPAAFKAAQESGKPAILHLKVDPQAISPAITLDAIRAKSLAAQGN